MESMHDFYHNRSLLFSSGMLHNSHLVDIKQFDVPVNELSKFVAKKLQHSKYIASTIQNFTTLQLTNFRFA